MASYREELKRKTVSAAQAAAMVQPDSWLEYGFGVGQPDLFDRALAARIPELSGVKIRGCLALAPRAVAEADPGSRHVRYMSWYFSGLERKMHDRNLCDHVPMNFGEVPDYYRRFLDSDFAVIKTAPMDEHGFFNFGGSIVYHKAISGKDPHADGRDQCLDALRVRGRKRGPYRRGRSRDRRRRGPDAGAQEFARQSGRRKSRPADRRGDRGRRVYPDRNRRDAQRGMRGAAASPIKELGVHTEMFVDSLIDLYEAGKVTGEHKRLNRFQMAFTFAAGSARLYRFLDRNPLCFAAPVDYTNLPQNIMQNDRVVAIVNAAQIDLTGQACSESAGLRQISGTGGQLQFVRGAYASQGGKAFLCMSSVYERQGPAGARRESRIMVKLPEHAIVTTPRTDVMYVVTEFGIANLKGKSVPERARALIALAHPDFREELERQARECRLIPRGFF